jgi:hypothetical protein
MARKRIPPILPTEYIDDGIFRDPRPQKLTLEQAFALLEESIKEPPTFREWIGAAEELIAGKLDKYLTEAAKAMKGVYVLNATHLVPDAHPVTRDLLNALRNCRTLNAARDWNAEGVFSFHDVHEAYYLGAAIQRIDVRPMARFARSGKASRAGAAKSRASRTSQAVHRREDTQQAVRERWSKNPKLSLSSIRQALAKLDDKRFGSLRTIEQNTAGMKRQK